MGNPMESRLPSTHRGCAVLLRDTDVISSLLAYLLKPVNDCLSFFFLLFLFLFVSFTEGRKFLCSRPYDESKTFSETTLTLSAFIAQLVFAGLQADFQIYRAVPACLWCLLLTYDFS